MSIKPGLPISERDSFVCVLTCACVRVKKWNKDFNWDASRWSFLERIFRVLGAEDVRCPHVARRRPFMNIPCSLRRHLRPSLRACRRAGGGGGRPGRRALGAGPRLPPLTLGLALCFRRPMLCTTWTAWSRPCRTPSFLSSPSRSCSWGCSSRPLWWKARASKASTTSGGYTVDFQGSWETFKGPK